MQLTSYSGKQASLHIFTSHNHPMTQILLLAQFTEGKIQASSKSKHEDSVNLKTDSELLTGIEILYTIY